MVWQSCMIPFKRPVLFLSVFMMLCLGQQASAESIKFEKQSLKIKDKQISVEIAKSADQRRQGLMGRKSLGKNEGMLFVFDRSQILSFWMKNTLIPLSIGFFDSEKKLINVLKMHPPKSVMVKDAMLPRYSSSKPAKYALEMNIGWFESNGIVPGDVFEFLPD